MTAPGRRHSLALPLLLVLALAVPAGAQTGYTFTIDAVAVTDELVPPGGLTYINITWTVACDGIPSPPTEPHARVHWNAEAPDGLVVAGPSQQLAALPQCPVEASVEGEVTFQIGAGHTMPALVPHQVRFIGVLEAPHVVPPEAANDTAEATVVVAYMSRMVAMAEEKLIQGSPGETSTAHLLVAELGNAPTTVAIAAEGDAADRLEAPSMVELTYPGNEDRPDMIEVAYVHPDRVGFDNSESRIRLLLRPHATEMPDAAGETRAVNILFRTHSLGQETPGPAMLPALLVLGAVVVMSRRCRTQRSGPCRPPGP